MKKSEKILRKNNIPEEKSDLEKQVIKNTVLLEHLINNEMDHLWKLFWGILILLLGLAVKAFL